VVARPNIPGLDHGRAKRPRGVEPGTQPVGVRADQSRIHSERIGRMTQLRKRRLGRTDWMVTELGLGCYQFTGEFKVPQEEAGRILDCAIESGINFIDTAPMYGSGEAEELVGRALQRHEIDGIYVATKIGWLDRTIIRSFGEVGYCDAAALTRAIKH